MEGFVKRLEKFQMGVGVFFLTIFFGVIILQIISRYLGISIIWTVELATNTFIWAMFMGAAVMVNQREHFNFDFLQRKLTGKSREVLNLVNDTVLILFNIAIFIYSIQVTVQFWNYQWTSIPELKKGYVWISIPIMSATMVIYTISHMITHVKNLREKGLD